MGFHIVDPRRQTLLERQSLWGPGPSRGAHQYGAMFHPVWGETVRQGSLGGSDQNRHGLYPPRHGGHTLLYNEWTAGVQVPLSMYLLCVGEPLPRRQLHRVYLWATTRTWGVLQTPVFPRGCSPSFCDSWDAFAPLGGCIIGLSRRVSTTYSGGSTIAFFGQEVAIKCFSFAIVHCTSGGSVFTGFCVLGDLSTVLYLLIGSGFCNLHLAIYSGIGNSYHATLVLCNSSVTCC